MSLERSIPKQVLSARTRIRAQRGITVVEYAMAGGLIAAAIVAAFLLLGLTISDVLTRIASVFS